MNKEINNNKAGQVAIALYVFAPAAVFLSSGISAGNDGQLAGSALAIGWIFGAFFNAIPTMIAMQKNNGKATVCFLLSFFIPVLGWFAALLIALMTENPLTKAQEAARHAELVAAVQRGAAE